MDNSTLGSEFYTCIRIDEASYFHHGCKEDMLNSKQRKQLVSFLMSPHKYKRFSGTNWEYLVFLWNNENNSQANVEEDQPMPNYLNLR